MKFQEAIKQLKAGNRVRRPIWGDESYWKLSKDDKTILWTDGTNAHVHINQIEANDWEIVEESSFCLSDTFDAYEFSLRVTDIRKCFQLIKKDIEKVRGWHDKRVDPKYILKIIHKRAGDKLLL